MSAPLRITLTEEEDRTLSELRQAQSVPYRTRDRAHMLRLNAQGMNVPAIAEVFQCHQQTVRATLIPLLVTLGRGKRNSAFNRSPASQEWAFHQRD
jgi:hypothetical protein